MNVSLIVGSADSYADCYEPFFHLLHDYWPDCPKPVYLLTEAKTWNSEALPVVSSCNGRCAWGKNLRLTVERTTTDYILLFMIDYFLERPVNHRQFLHFLETAQRRHVSCLNFIPLAGNAGTVTPDGLVAMEKRIHDKVNCQVALWEKNAILRHLRDHETPHDFERWGTRRAWRQEDSFYTVSPAWEEREGKIFDYALTGGIRNGKWIPELVEPMFREHGISIDLTRRGLFRSGEKRPPPALSTRLFRLLKSPRKIYHRWLSLR